MTGADGVQLKLHTQHATTEVRWPAVEDLPEATCPIGFQIVHRITSSEFGDVHNPEHFSQAAGIEFEGEAEGDTITLAMDRAARLVGCFRRLAPGHQLDCHDFVGEVIGWGGEKGLGPGYIQDGSLLFSKGIVSGRPYGLFLPQGSDWRRLHSFLGTDSKKCLGLVAKGLMLSVMMPSTAQRLYSRGYPSGFAETVTRVN